LLSLRICLARRLYWDTWNTILTIAKGHEILSWPLFDWVPMFCKFGKTKA
jgi:hypothetical protein